MRIVIAPDSFKGTLSAAAAAAAMAQGVRRVVPAADVAVFPMADGGEGTLEVLLAAQGGVRYEVDTWDPLGRPVRAAFGWLASGAGRTAVVELAAASGLVFLAEAERTPSAALAASTYGTGELIRAALDAGADEVVLTLGGSATTDGGFGLLTALGATARAAGGRPLSGRDARELGLVEHVDLAGLHPRFHHVVFRLASDVTHPLCGPDGAARVFGPQKGMDEAAIVRRDEELARWAERLSAAARTAGLGRAAEDVRAVPGLGAA
ncbi:glycerate kinase, partial [Alicyclobacillus cellulosilyticus]|uniref:glycerate kinase n=1 Tax=Alicyclobacillus cellulosilyticus TaxID=1003997 RepID=UPI00166AE027